MLMFTISENKIEKNFKYLFFEILTVVNLLCVCVNNIFLCVKDNPVFQNEKKITEKIGIVLH